MTGPPRLDLSIDEAHAWIEQHEHTTITKQTVYNWANKGRKGHVLQTHLVAGKKKTRIAWIKEFLDAVNAA